MSETKIHTLDRGDWLAGLTAFGISLCVFLFTTAPSVTLLDSGEFMTAAADFGVPHPTGYPLWTLLAWLFTLLPLGNAAWEINLFSGLCGALGIGVLAATGSGMAKWFAPAWVLPSRSVRVCAFGVSVGFALLAAFSPPVWTQAVIAEVYTLHLLLTALFVFALFRLARNPDDLRAFVHAIFFWALGMSNHHLMLSLAVVPLILLVLVRGDLFIEIALYLLASLSIVYLGFGLLSNDPPTLSTASRLFYCVVAGIGLLAFLRRGLPNLRWLPRILIALLLGLLPYLYLPAASSTNPPMNWGYTRARDGFFHSINRSQYQGPLHEQLLHTLGRLLGSAPKSIEAEADTTPKDSLPNLAKFSALYWFKLVEGIGLLPVFGFLFALLATLRLERNQRALMFCLALGFFLAAFLQPLFSNAAIDHAGWLLQMPYHGYSYALFTLLGGIGVFALLSLLTERWKFAPWIGVLALALPLWAGIQNAAFCSQREHWFGWFYGHEMVANLPKKSVLLGGSDPGRFVPTYMILSESPQPAKHKRDPDFDRRDLTILTQNALIDPFYLRYVRDQYGPDRPPVKNAVERWLRRDTAYPNESLILPTEEEIRTQLEALEKRNADDPTKASEPRDVGEMNGAIAQWIWEKNRAKHRFFVEESFPMEWTYPYAVPHGLIYEILPEKLESLPPETISADMQYWNSLVKRFLEDPRFLNDIDARHSFSKLRNTGGNLYKSRKLDREAEFAWRQALALWPGQIESVRNLSLLLMEQARHDEAVELIKQALFEDPYNESLIRFRDIVRARRLFHGEIRSLEAVLAEAPGGQSPSKRREAILRLLENYRLVDDTKTGDAFARQTLAEQSKDAIVLEACLNYFVARQLWPDALATAVKLEAANPDTPSAKLTVAKLLVKTGNLDGFYAKAEEAIRLGGLPVREQIKAEPLFERFRKESKFQKLVSPGTSHP